MSLLWVRFDPYAHLGTALRATGDPGGRNPQLLDQICLEVGDIAVGAAGQINNQRDYETEGKVQ